jgi:hypothetical protein
MSSYILGIVNSAAFQMSRAAGTETAIAGATGRAGGDVHHQ